MNFEIFALIQIRHTDQKSSDKLAITVDRKHYDFLNDLHKQYGDFTITKEDGQIIITTK